MTTTTKIYKLDYIKLKVLATAKEIKTKMKNMITYEKIVYCRIYDNIYKGKYKSE